MLDKINTFLFSLTAKALLLSKSVFTKTRTKTFTIAAAVASLFLYLTLTSAIEISSLGIGLTRYIMVVIVSWLIQEFGYHEIDTMKTFKENPVLYVAYVIAHVIAAAICFSFSV